MDGKYKGVFYHTYGIESGQPVVFLHGYLESSEIWNNIAELLSDEYYIITLDIPGHGASNVPDREGSMPAMAEAVFTIMDHLGIKRYHLIGHSMGGYLLLQLVHENPDSILSAILVHSNCFADSEEKKINRDREILMVREGKKELIVNTNIPRLYANNNLGKMSDKIEWSKQLARQTNDKGIIFALEAMKGRPDRSKILKEGRIPFLLIGGRNDNLIPFEKMEEMKGLSHGIKLECLENSGHMGFFEEPDKTLNAIRNFLNDHYECQ